MTAMYTTSLCVCPSVGPSQSRDSSFADGVALRRTVCGGDLAQYLDVKNDSATDGSLRDLLVCLFIDWFASLRYLEQVVGRVRSLLLFVMFVVIVFFGQSMAPERTF